MKARPVGKKVLVEKTPIPNTLLNETDSFSVVSENGSLGVVLDLGSDVPKTLKPSDVVVFKPEGAIQFNEPGSQEGRFLLNFEDIYAILGSGSPEDAFEAMKRRIGVSSNE